MSEKQTEANLQCQISSSFDYIKSKRKIQRQRVKAGKLIQACNTWDCFKQSFSSYDKNSVGYQKFK